MPRLPGMTYAISDTGPLISAFQSTSFGTLARIFAEIRIPMRCLAELERHGWEAQIESAMPQLVVVELTAREETLAIEIAERIANHPDSDDPVIEHHLGEAQAIVLPLRSEYQDDLLLIDELAARAIAKEQGVKLSGFPGVLLLAVRGGLMSAEELRVRLEECRAQGTHYGASFVQEVYRMAKREWRPN